MLSIFHQGYLLAAENHVSFFLMESLDGLIQNMHKICPHDNIMMSHFLVAKMFCRAEEIKYREEKWHLFSEFLACCVCSKKFCRAKRIKYCEEKWHLFSELPTMNSPTKSCNLAQGCPKDSFERRLNILSKNFSGYSC